MLQLLSMTEIGNHTNTEAEPGDVVPAWVDTVSGLGEFVLTSARFDEDHPVMPVPVLVAINQTTQAESRDDTRLV